MNILARDMLICAFGATLGRCYTTRSRNAVNNQHGSNIVALLLFIVGIYELTSNEQIILF